MDQGSPPTFPHLADSWVLMPMNLASSSVPCLHLFPFLRFAAKLLYKRADFLDVGALGNDLCLRLHGSRELRDCTLRGADSVEPKAASPPCGKGTARRGAVSGWLFAKPVVLMRGARVLVIRAAGRLAARVVGVFHAREMKIAADVG